jgi:phosphatidylglycerol:prolipoprotein diacylglycerol transferase
VSGGEDGPQGLTATFWFDSGTEGPPSAATVRFSGRRVGVAGVRGPRDTFTKDETIDRVVPGSGRVSVTTRVHGINPGEWSITADVLRPQRAAPGERTPPSRARQATPAAWSWRRWALSEGAAKPVKARWAPLMGFDPVPAVLPGSYTVLVLLGVLVALVLQARLVAHAQVDAGRVLTVSLVALLAGLAGAKLWYLALHPRRWRKSVGVGWCIQGFLAGAVLAVAGMLVILRVPIGTVLDATAPGVFVGLAVGRLGCFFTGCCAVRRRHAGPCGARIAGSGPVEFLPSCWNRLPPASSV